MSASSEPPSTTTGSQVGSAEDDIGRTHRRRDLLNWQGGIFRLAQRRYCHRNLGLNLPGLHAGWLV